MNAVASLTTLGTGRRVRLARAGAAAILSLGIVTGLGSVLQDAGLPALPATDAASGPHMIATAAEIARLSTTSTAWKSMKKAADSNAGRPDLSNQDSNQDVVVLAKAFVYARTHSAFYRNAVLANLRAVVGTEAGGRTLSLARGIPAYVIAADLISLPTFNPSFNNGTFRPWLRRLLTESLQGLTLIRTQETRPNNWGTHAGAARAAIAIYLGDTAQVRRTAKVFKGWLGDRASYAGFDYGDLSWQCNPAKPVGINPAGCQRGRVSLNGALPDDLRRGGSFQWPPGATGYPWEALQGAVLEAELLQRAGYPAWSWQNKALLRAARFLYSTAGWPANSNDDWQPWLIDYRYGTAYHRASPTHPGKNFGWTDWLYGTRVKGSSTWVKVGDGSRLVRYVNGWTRLAAGSYSDGRIHAARRSHAKAVLSFGGSAVVWIGTRGPTQGRAVVYIDGRRARVVNLHSAFRQYHARLFSYTFSRAGSHHLTIMVLGTAGHPTVTVDGFLVHR